MPMCSSARVIVKSHKLFVCVFVLFVKIVCLFKIHEDGEQEDKVRESGLEPIRRQPSFVLTNQQQSGVANGQIVEIREKICWFCV